ncbi:MAG: ABC transporter ATP-binding protein [Clostridia bacterium]|nr:ABC transporter ATP-binding protein [Clostridia bacterium]MDY5558892.1 ABC transporter ATP-binding protein [Candidatus Heritagella sp.]
MAQPIIEICHVTKIYTLFKNNKEQFLSIFYRSPKLKKHLALDDVTFSVEKGESVGIIGNNGAGKSTILKTITGVTFPTSGQVEVRGRVAALLELTAGFEPEMTGRENIYLKGYILGLRDEYIHTIEEKVIDFAQLGDYIDQPVRTYSSGMKMRLGFSININTDPEILVVDEALSVGDNAFKKKCKDAIKDLIARGTTVLYVSHNADSVQEVCRRAIYLKKGKLVFDGPVEQALELYRVDNPPKTAKGKKNPTPAERVANARKALAEKDKALIKAAAEKKAAEEELAAAEQAEALALKESDPV